MIKVVEYDNTFPHMIDIIVDDMSIAQIEFCKIEVRDEHITLYDDEIRDFANIVYDEMEIIP